jgi:hypothetical protein
VVLLARGAAMLLAASAVALGIILGPSPAPAHAATTKTVVYGMNGRCPSGTWGTPEVRPKSAFFSLACENGIRHIHWRTWRLTSAFGHGDILTFNGFRLVPHAGTITLSGVRSHNGRRYFSHMVMRWTTKGGHHHKEVLNWKKINHGMWLWVGNYQ